MKLNDFTTSIVQQGNPDNLFFLPFWGEFGAYLTTFVHAINSTQCKNKAVAILPRHNILFPNAQHFFDWDISIPDIKKNGCNRSRGSRNELMQYIIKTYPAYKNYTFIEPFFRFDSTSLPYKRIDLPQLNNLDVNPDIVICPRYRQKHIGKNLTKEFWVDLINQLGSLSIAVAGDKETTHQDLPVAYRSWDYHYAKHDIVTSIELMQKAKTVITTNTGGMHLANMCNANMVVLLNSNGMIDYVRHLQKDNKIIYIPKNQITVENILSSIQDYQYTSY